MITPAKQPHSAPTIRPATAADVLPMAKVHITSWREIYPGMLPEQMLARMSIAAEAIRWQRMLDRPGAWGGAISFVAEHDGSVVGYGSCSEQRSRPLRARGFTGEISELYMLRSAQRRGAGVGLMKAMAGALLEQGHPSMSLWVLEQNMTARSFYEGLGGVAIAEKRDGLIEVAYGWPDLQLLAAQGRD